MCPLEFTVRFAIRQACCGAYYLDMDLTPYFAMYPFGKQAWVSSLSLFPHVPNGDNKIYPARLL